MAEEETVVPVTESKEVIKHRCAIGSVWAAPVQRSTQPVIPTDSGFEFQKLVGAVHAFKDEALDYAAYRGNATQSFRLAARDVHLATRAHYKDMMNNIGANIYPLMVIADSDSSTQAPGGVGGMITVYRSDLSIQRYVPTPPNYELLKNMSHMPIGIFTIVSPWFRNDGKLETTNLKTFLVKVQDALRYARDSKVDVGDTDILAHVKKMLEITETHLKKWIEAEICTVGDYEVYTTEMNVYVPNNIINAATIQAEALYKELSKIKEEMGEAWEKLWVVIPTVWPVAGINPRVEIISRLMTPDQVNTRVFCMDNLSDLFMYRQTLGRIIGDRCSANLILRETVERKEAMNQMLYALSTRQDLMANASHKALDDIQKAEKDLDEKDKKEEKVTLEEKDVAPVSDAGTDETPLAGFRHKLHAHH